MGVADDFAGDSGLLQGFLQRIIGNRAGGQRHRISGDFFHLAVGLYFNTGCGDLQCFGGGFGPNAVPVQFLENSPAGGFTDVAAHFVDHLDNNDFLAAFNGHPVKVFGILGAVDQQKFYGFGRKGAFFAEKQSGFNADGTAADDHYPPAGDHFIL